MKISLPGMLFGVYDGHGGASCGIVTANRLQHYITAGLLPTEDLRNHLDQLKLAGTYIYKSNDYVLVLKNFQNAYKRILGLRDQRQFMRPMVKLQNCIE